MSELILWKTRQINKLRRDIDRLFTLPWSDFGGSLFCDEVEKGPSIDIFETEDAIVVRAELHGITPADLDISVTSESLIIRGKKREETIKSSTFSRRFEGRISSFSRTIPLPCKVKVDIIKATYKKGILNIVMPKWESEKARVIEIQIK
ncbi:MAG: Hsp20/alpha crystallin family protein [Deltaproteobacteria bacterium]|nr:Hsp20/alpha crystallin family protein [Deltaproteobacteria bacterium]